MSNKGSKQHKADIYIAYNKIKESKIKLIWGKYNLTKSS
jgi:hypothetical protein